jgi:hypothetical protein
MKKNSFLMAVCCTLCLGFSALADAPKLTLYVPFDGDINAKIAGGNAQGKYGLPGAPQFADGVAGQGIINGASNQHVVFDAAGNISPEQWTITFWMKGLPGAQWNKSKFLQSFWELNGSDGFMWFYRYSNPDLAPWLFSKIGTEESKSLQVPKANEEEWHYWAVTWRRGSGAYVYLDGQLVGQSPGEPPKNIKNIAIGQRENPAEQNKIIDEFKIYDTALDAGFIARLYRQEGNFALQPLLSSSKTTREIVIDGKIGAEEWANAAGFSGLIDDRTWGVEAPPTIGKITYDAQNLYVALHSQQTAAAKAHPDTVAQHGFVKKDAVQPDGAVRDDDHFFLQLSPDAVNGKIYSIAVNGLDTIYDAVSTPGTMADVSWQSGARVKSQIDGDGWTMEMAIPLKSLGIASIADDASWRANFGRVWKQLLQRTDVWAAGQRGADGKFSEQSGLGTLNFSGNQDASASVQQFLIRPDGRVQATVNVANDSNTARDLSIVFKAAKGTLQEEKVALQPGEHKTLALAGLPKDSDGGLISLSVQSGPRVLLSQAWPLILERAGQLQLWSYPGSHQVRFGWTIHNAADPVALRLDAEFKDADNHVAKTVSSERLSSLNGSALFDVQSLADGKYTIEAKISDGQNVLQEQAISFEKKPLPDWLGNSFGKSELPPAPWTNVEVAKAKDAVSIWGRSYEYSGRLLPTQIINQGQPMLAAPMQLVVQSKNGGAQSSRSATAGARWTSETATHADSLRSQVLGDVKITADSSVEFDGMTWMNITLAPQAGKADVQELTLEIPLKKEWANLIKPATDYTMKQTGALPANGWKGDAATMPWVGNADGGIQIFQESTATWIGSKSVEVVPQNDGVTMRVHLIDAPASLEKPLRFSLGFMASPVKPAPKNHRDWRVLLYHPGTSTPGSVTTADYIERAVALNPNLKFLYLWFQGWGWLPDQNYKGNYDLTGPVPVPAGDRKSQTIKEYAGAQLFSAPYGRLSEMGTANPWFAQFGDEWVPDTRKFAEDSAVAPELRATQVSQASASLRDFYAWGYHRLLEEGNAQALYFDVSRPLPDSNLYHGAGTLLPDGSIEPTLGLLGTRRMFQRIYTMLKAKHPDGLIFYHTSGEINLPILSFCDAIVDGENYAGILDRKENRGYESVLRLDQFRAEYSAQNNFGPATLFLPQFERANSIAPDEWKTLGTQHADYLLGLALLHDSAMWWIWMPQEYLSQLYSALDTTGWNAQWKFVPYWQQKFAVLPTGVNLSLYQSPGAERAVAIVMNTSGEEQNIEFPTVMKQANFKTAKVIYPLQDGSTPNAKSAALKIAANSFCAVLLEK